MHHAGLLQGQCNHFRVNVTMMRQACFQQCRASLC
jgi:hypothetical protein